MLNLIKILILDVLFGLGSNAANDQQQEIDQAFPGRI